MAILFYALAVVFLVISGGSLLEWLAPQRGAYASENGIAFLRFSAMASAAAAMLFFGYVSQTLREILAELRKPKHVDAKYYFGDTAVPASGDDYLDGDT